MSAPSSPTPTTEIVSPPNEGLTPRQQQILALLQEGKGNKEIASELGIHVGTVKQHVVALFKKLNVRNRTMAVARHGTPHEAPPTPAAPLTSPALPAQTQSAVTQSLENGDSLLEKRPCVILSLSIGPRDDAAPLPEMLSSAQRRQGGRRLHAALATLAYDYDAVLLAHRGHAADIIFGIQRTGEHDLLHALRSAQAVAAELSLMAPAAAAHLHGGLTAGLAIASMKRQGGWTGEAIASPGISAARLLGDSATAGTLRLDGLALDLMVASGIAVSAQAPVLLQDLPREHSRNIPFDALAHLKTIETPPAGPLRGRSLELSTLYTALDSAQRRGIGLVLLTGEAGMGKSHLSRAFAERCRKDAVSVTRWRCQPGDAPPSAEASQAARITCDDHGADYDLAEFLKHLTAPVQTSPQPRVTILDDVHWLEHDEQAHLLSVIATLLAAPPAAETGPHLVVLALRRLRPALRAVLPEDSPALSTIRLQRLPKDSIAALASDRLGSLPLGSAPCQGIAERASGVPLFAVELARHWPVINDGGKAALPAHPPLSLLSLVSARLDHLSLDRHLLRTVARSTSPLSAEQVAAKLDIPFSHAESAIERAVGAGVLTLSPTRTLAFSHPLLRAVITFLALDKPS